MSTPWTQQRIIEATKKLAAQYGGDAAVILATFQQESGLNPLSVGDNGTSFGLRQRHRGGALGTHSAAWAENPGQSLRSDVQALSPARTGKQVAAIQRPAKPGAYAANLDVLIKQWRTKLATGFTASGVGRAKWSPDRDAVASLAASMGMTHSSGDRSPDNNPGAANSAHLTTRPDVWADDYTGTAAQLAAFYAAGKAKFPNLNWLPNGHVPSTGPNVHVDGKSSGSASAPSSTASTTPPMNASLTSGLPGASSIASAAVKTVFVLGGVALVVFGVIQTSGGLSRPVASVKVTQ